MFLIYLPSSNTLFYMLFLLLSLKSDCSLRKLQEMEWECQRSQLGGFWRVNWSQKLGKNPLSLSMFFPMLQS